MTCQYKDECSYYDYNEDNPYCNGNQQWYCGCYKNKKRGEEDIKNGRRKL